MVAKLKCIAHNASVLEWRNKYDPSYYRHRAEHALNRAHFLRAHEDLSEDVLNEQGQRVLRKVAHQSDGLSA